MALITTGQAARIASVTRETIQNYIKDGKLVPAERTLGGHYRLDEKHVRDILCSPRIATDMLA